MNENIYLSIACGLGAAFTYFRRIQKHKKAAEQANFPCIKGKITGSSILTKEHSSTNDDGTTDTSLSFVPRVVYQYEVNGTGYENDRIAVLDEQTFGRQEYADAFISRYATGSDITVYYDPKDPSVSFLDNSVSKQKVDFGTWVIIALLLVGAGYFLFS